MATEAPRKRNLVALLIVALTFIAGAGTGAGLHASFAPRGPRHPGPGKGSKLHRLPPPFEELELTAEQRKQVEALVEKFHPRFEALFQESFPRVRALRDEMDAELLPLLTEEQRARFEALKKNRPERPGGPPGFGPPRGPPPP